MFRGVLFDEDSRVTVRLRASTPYLRPAACIVWNSEYEDGQCVVEVLTQADIAEAFADMRKYAKKNVPDGNCECPRCGVNAVQIWQEKQDEYWFVCPNETCGYDWYEGA